MVLSWAKSAKRLGRRPPYVSFGQFERKGTKLLLKMRNFQIKGWKTLLFVILWWWTKVFIDDGPLSLINFIDWLALFSWFYDLASGVYFPYTLGCSFGASFLYILFYFTYQIYIYIYIYQPLSLGSYWSMSTSSLTLMIALWKTMVMMHWCFMKGLLGYQPSKCEHNNVLENILLVYHIFNWCYRCGL